ncbi:MAG: hypothetical protein HY318_13225 [Armatimonadetes bacterium]|nr:hypothetical protein [Armatimonadota bacterium]
MSSRWTAVQKYLWTGFLAALMVRPAQVARAEEKKKPDISGSQILTYRTSSVSGGTNSTSAYQLDNYGADKKLQNQTSLNVNGPLYGNFSIEGRYYSSPFGVSDRRWTLRYDAGSTDLAVGDLNVSFPGSDLTSFSKTLQGLEIDTEFGKDKKLNFVVSQTKALAATDALQGNNTVGPYYLTHSPILDGTEQVRVDEQVKIRGVDYTIDYTFGSITFRIGTIIPSTSTIAISYEYNPAGQTSGTFYGLRGTIPVSKKLSLGMTYLLQDSRPTGGASGPTREHEEFYGQNSPGPYGLTFRPIVLGSERITLNAITQVQGLDYEISYTSGGITFLRPVPPTSLIVVEYDYQPGGSTTTGDHKVTGIDGSWAFAKDWNTTFELAQSQGGASSAQSGTAYSLRTIGQAGSKLNVNFGLRNIASGFNRIESTGFARDESGYDWGLQYLFSKSLKLQSQYNNFTSAQGLYFGSTGASGGAGSDTSQLNAVLSYDKPGLPQLKITHQRLTSSSAGASTTVSTATPNNSAYVSNNLEMNFSKGKVGVNGNLALIDQSNSVTSSATSSSSGDSQTRNSRLGLFYNPFKPLQLRADLAANNVQSGGAKVSSASSQNLSASFAPGSRLRVELTRYSTSSEGTGLGSTYTGSYMGSIGFGSGFGGYGGYGSGYGYGSSGSGSNWGSMGGSSSPGWGTTSSSFGRPTTGTTGFFNNGINSTGYTYGSGGYNYGSGSSGGWGAGSSGWGNPVGTTTPSSFKGNYRPSGFSVLNVTTQGLTTNSVAPGLTNQGVESGITAGGSVGVVTDPYGRAPSRTPTPLPKGASLLDDSLRGEHYVASLGPSTYVPADPRLRSLPRQSSSSTSTFSSTKGEMTSLRMEYALTSKISLNGGTNRQLNSGVGSVTNSDSKDMSLGGTYRVSDKLSLLSQYTEQRLKFLDSTDNSHSKISSFSVQLGLPDKLNVFFDYQRMLTFTNEGSTFLGGVGGFAESQLDSYSARVNYPLSTKINLFSELYDFRTIGSDTTANNARRELSLGLDYRINRLFTLTSRWSNIRTTYVATPDQNYKASTFETQLQANF